MGYSSSNTRLRRRRSVYRRLGNRILLGIIGTAVLILVLWGLSNWLLNAWGRWGIKVEAVQSGVLQETINLDAVVINRETAVLTPVEGKFFPALKEGERVRKGQQLGAMLGESLAGRDPLATIYSPANGLLRLHLDGTEGLFTQENWEKLDLSQLTPPAAASDRTRQNSLVAAGGTVAVVVDNLTPTMLALEVEANAEGRSLEAAKELWLQLKPDQPFVRAAVLKQLRAGDKARLLLKLPDFQEELLLQRKTPAVLALNRWSGVIVPSGSLVRQGDDSGVFVVYKGIAEWRRVELIGASGGQTAVSGIDSGELVVVNPALVKSGMRIR
ncbi:MAG: hypothetical protein HPY50_11855 [Firmicutes bacterium]|nr:hypothetical protein [Bacillota bacterium]